MLLPPEMASEPIGGTPPRDVRPVVAAGLCVLAVILGWPLLRGEEKVPEPPLPDGPRATAPSAEPVDAPVAASGASGDEARVAARPAGAKTDPSAPVRTRPETSGEPAIDDTAADAAGAEPETPSGIGLFPPPGTDPPKSGIVVPDDYELPPGYVRHYQATDDGQQLQPILMFHPDFQPVDDRGRPIKLPKDRVVPPSLAPPGLPIEKLAVPKTNVPQIEHPPNATQDPPS
jgi:hypothetical protein